MDDMQTTPHAAQTAAAELPIAFSPKTQQWLFWSMIIICLASIAASGALFYSYLKTRHDIVQEVKDKAIGESKKAAQDINKFLDKLKPIVDSFTEKIASGSIPFAAIAQELPNAVPAGEDINIGVAFAPFAYEKSTKLYAPYYAKREGKYQLIQAEQFFDYTDPKFERFNTPSAKGAGFIRPFMDPALKEKVAEYAVPFYEVNPTTKERTVKGIVFANFSLSKINYVVNSLELGRKGYGFLIGNDSLFITHPDVRLVNGVTTFWEIGRKLNIVDIGKLEQEGQVGKDSVFLEYTNALTGQPSWLIIEPILSPQWSLGSVFPREEIEDYSLSSKRHLIWVILLFFLSLAMFFFLVFGAYSGEKKSLWFSSVALSLIFATITGLTWFMAIKTAFYYREENDIEIITDRISLKKFISTTIAPQKEQREAKTFDLSRSIDCAWCTIGTPINPAQRQQQMQAAPVAQQLSSQQQPMQQPVMQQAPIQQPMMQTAQVAQQPQAPGIYHLPTSAVQQIPAPAQQAPAQQQLQPQTVAPAQQPAQEAPQQPRDTTPAQQSAPAQTTPASTPPTGQQPQAGATPTSSATAPATAPGTLMPIPTGFFLQNISFVDGSTIKIVGQVWQRYPKNYPKNMKKGVTFRQARQVDLKEAYEFEDTASIVTGWDFNAQLFQVFDYEKYPFDSRKIRIQLSPKEFSQNILLVPDFTSYTITIPTSLPGLSKDVPIEQWNFEKSYFGYKNNDYLSNFGVYVADQYGSLSKQVISKSPELYFNIDIQRNVIGTIIIDLMPLILVFSLLFLILLLVGTGQMATYHVLGAISSLFFSVLLSHLRFKGDAKTTQIVFFEYFYFVLHLTTLTVLILALLYLFKIKLKIFRREMLGVLVLYWPTVTFIFALISAVRFY